jgi:site-specific recombinase XerD
MKAPHQTNSFPALLQQFFLERLIQQRNASAQTVASYRDSFCLLLRFAKNHLGKAPERLTLSDLDAPLILAFLNSARSCILRHLGNRQLYQLSSVSWRSR